MNASEIADAVSALVEGDFDGDEFPFQFLEAFGNKGTTISRLRSGTTNQSDIDKGVLQRNHIHLLVCGEGQVSEGLKSLRESPRNTKCKVKFLLASDGKDIEAENLIDGQTLACSLPQLAERFGFFLALAGITTVKEIEENAFDIRATGRLNKLYIELLKQNPDWATDARRPDMNHFMARLIFCFFAEDTDIFTSENLFTSTVEQMAARDSSDTHEVIGHMFQSMNVPKEERGDAGIPKWVPDFPYVNGGLFSGAMEVPKFSKIARTYLLHVGHLDWTQINPDIFGSMIQAVADEEERGALGMHYTSVPNILKVLNPLFLDELNGKLEAAGDNARKLLNLRNRIARIRVFDPACGSGNFLVIAYKEIRKIEAEINRRRNEHHRRSDIPLTNFRGIEIKSFSAEIARLALIIAEYQCNVLYLGQQEALADFLPLDTENWITRGNALRLDWLSICPPTGTRVRTKADDLLETSMDHAEVDFENEGGETFVCGNPPYLGFTWQSKMQKLEIKALLSGVSASSGFLDYIAGWFLKASEFLRSGGGTAVAFVSTNSICQGQSVPILWPVIFGMGVEINFAHTSFKWNNLASNNAGVTVVIVGLRNVEVSDKAVWALGGDGNVMKRVGPSITPYLTLGDQVIVRKLRKPISVCLAEMEFGNKPSDGGYLLLEDAELGRLSLTQEEIRRFIRRIYGSGDFINGGGRNCIWIEDEHLEQAENLPCLAKRIASVRAVRLASRDKGANALAKRAHQLKLMRIGESHTIVVPGVSSERRNFLPVGLVDRFSTLTNLAFGLYDAPIWNLAIIASQVHKLWIATVCGKLKTDYRYSNTLGWNTFPVPPLTEQNKSDLTRCAEGILLAREAHFPATIADLYDPEKMPEDLRAAHDRNDETLERIYIGRRFKNDTERLEKLFQLYTEMTEAEA